MATTTGSTLYGLSKGMNLSLVGSIVAPAVFFVLGNPDGKITGPNMNGSDIAVDTTNGIYYISKAGSPYNGSTWYNLGSTT